MANLKRSPSRATRAGVVIGIFCAGGMACGRSTVLYEGEAFGTGTPGHGVVGGSSGRGGTSGQSGRSTGGTGGSVNTGGSFTTGGSVSGVGGSVAGSFAVGGSSGTMQGPYACAAVTPTCNAFQDFPNSAQVSWGSGAFTGGITVFGPGLVRDMDSSRLHVTGTLTGYAGIVLWFSRCSDLSAATGVQMTLTGSAGPNRPITFQPLTNANYPWQLWPEEGKGACTAPDPLDPFVYCEAPSVEFYPTNGPLFIAWNAFGGGMPTVWNPMSSPREIVGLEWLFAWDGGTPYDVDLTIDDVFLVGQASVDCVGPPTGAGGMSGAGGTPGSGGTAGGAGTSTMGGNGGTGQAGSLNDGGAAGVNDAGAGGETGTPSGGAPDAGFGGI